MAVAEREIAHPTPTRLYTEAEYLALEGAAEFRSEYVNGEIRPMSGGTLYHGALAMYLGAALIAALGDRDCLVMSSDVKVYAAGQMYYPDLSITCGPQQFHGGNRTVITNPLLVAEVLSPSTEATDRTEKLRNYRQIKSLAAYLLVSQNEPLIEQFSRAENGHWDYEAVAGMGSAITIPALSVTLALSDIYKRIKFDGLAAD